MFLNKMDKKTLTTLIIVAVCALVVGVIIGIIVQMKIYAPKEAKLQTYEYAVKSLSSKIIPSIMAYGQVEKIEGRKVTMSYNKETLEVPFKDSAVIYTFNPPTATSKTDKPTQVKVSFSEIKVGDNLSVTIKLLSDGVISGESAVILKKAN